MWNNRLDLVLRGSKGWSQGLQTQFYSVKNHLFFFRSLFGFGCGGGTVYSPKLGLRNPSEWWSDGCGWFRKKGGILNTMTMGFNTTYTDIIGYSYGLFFDDFGVPPFQETSIISNIRVMDRVKISTATPMCWCPSLGDPGRYIFRRIHRTCFVCFRCIIYIYIYYDRHITLPYITLRYVTFIHSYIHTFIQIFDVYIHIA